MDQKREAPGLGRPSGTYDVAIIGSGPGGYATALRSAQLGFRVALIEQDPVVGGTCLNRGCVPTKALLTATHVIEEARHAREMGVDLTPEPIDYDRLHAFQQEMVDAMTGGLGDLLSQRKVEVIRGRGSLAGPGRVEVARPDGEPFILNADNVVLAMGASSRPLPGIPFGGPVIDSDRALSLPRFPDRAVIVGSGAVALEFASMWRAAGSQVTLLIRHDRVLTGWSRRSGQVLTRQLRRRGIDIITGVQCTGVDIGQDATPGVSPGQGHPDGDATGEGGITVHYAPNGPKGPDPGQSAEGEESGLIRSDLLLAAVGRRPNTGAPWVGSAGLDLDRAGSVVTDAQGRTNLDHVWAVGDVTPGHQLANRAFQQGITVAEAMAGMDPEPVDDATVPQVVFSTPQAASVGYDRQAAQEDRTLTDVQETIYPMMANSRMRMSGQEGALSLVTACRAEDLDTRVIVGAQIISPQASENIAEVEELIGNRVPLHRAAGLIHPHPTFSETLGEALLKADGRPLHMR